jgi:tetratricopeptide (TPR) repeat protein
MPYNSFSVCGAVSISIVLFLFGCGKEVSTADSITPVIFSSTDSCAIALYPHEGEDRTDQEIIRISHKMRHGDRSLEYLERLGWAYIAKARVSFDPGFYTLAEQTANCMDAQVSDTPGALLLRGHAMHNQHRFGAAEIVARKLISQRGLWFDYGLLGDALMEQGNLEEAIIAYQKMMDQRPGPQAYSRAAHIRWLKGDLNGAIELMQRTVAGIGSRSPESAAWSLVRLAVYQLQVGQKGLAAEQLQTALQHQPLYPPALLAQGRLLLAEGRTDQAITVLTQAFKLNSLPEYQWALIEALHTAGHEELTREQEQRLMQRGATDDARTFALYLAGVGWHLSTALHLLQEELKSRQDVYTLDAYAWVLHAMGKYQQAQRISQLALAQGTEDARLFYHAGLIALSLEHFQEAEEWLTKAIAIQQMLMPSERRRLNKEFATLKSQTTNLVSTQLTRQDHISH